MSIILNFYGSQKGLTEKQHLYITNKIKQYSIDFGIKEFRICDIIGNVEIHEYVLINNLAENIILYPPSNIEIRGFAAATNKVIIMEEMCLSQGIKSMCLNADVMIIAPHETDDDNNGPDMAKEFAKKMNVKEILTINYNGNTEQWPDKNILKIKNKIASTKTKNIMESINVGKVEENTY